MMESKHNTGEPSSGPQWTAISLTHVQYEKAKKSNSNTVCLRHNINRYLNSYFGDFIGYLLAWFSLLPICIIVAFITLIIFRRDLHTASYFVGIVLNEACNWILKHTIREARPQRDFAVLYTEYGMPSSHSQFMFFFSSYMVLFLALRLYQNQNWLDDVWKVIVALGSFTCSSIVAYSRIYLHYHTSSQVMWGCLTGSILGCLWFGVVQLILTPFFPYIAASPVGEFIMVRDSTLIPHVMWFEYTSSRSEARSRQRKLTARKSQ